MCAGQGATGGVHRHWDEEGSVWPGLGGGGGWRERWDRRNFGVGRRNGGKEGSVGWVGGWGGGMKECIGFGKYGMAEFIARGGEELSLN